VIGSSVFGVRPVVALSLELYATVGRVVGRRRFQHALLYRQRVGVEVLGEVRVAGPRVGHVEQPVVDARLEGHAARGRHPVNRPVRGGVPTALGGGAPAGVGIDRATQLHDLAVLVFDDLLAGQKISVTEAHLPAGRQADEVLGRVLLKVVSLDVEFAGEGDLARVLLVDVTGPVRGLQPVHLALLDVGDDHLQRVEHGHDARGLFVEVVS